MKCDDPTIPLEKDLHAIRLCIELAFVSSATVSDWACAVVAAEDAPDVVFCELACAALKREQELLDLLEGYRDARSHAATWEKVLAWTADRIRADALDADHAVRRISTLAGDVDKLYTTFITLEDQYACARDGVHGTLPEARNSLLEALDRLGRPGGLGVSR